MKKIPCDPIAMQVAEDLLLAELVKKFPEAWYTTFATKWNDGTFMIEVRHGEPINEKDECNIHHFEWYDGKITYRQSTIPAMRGNS